MTMDWSYENQTRHAVPVKVHINPNFRGKPCFPGMQGIPERPAGIHFNPHWKPRSTAVDTLMSNEPAIDVRDTSNSSLPPSQKRTIHINPKVIQSGVSQSISTLLQQQLSSRADPLPAVQNSVDERTLQCQTQQRSAAALSSNRKNCEVSTSSKISRPINSPAQVYKLQRNVSCSKSPAIRTAKIVCSKYKYLNTSMTTNLAPQHLLKLQNSHPITKPAASSSRFKYVKKSPDARKPGISPKIHIVSQFKLVKRAPASMSSTLTPRRLKTQKSLENAKNMPEHTIKSRYKLSKGIALKPVSVPKNRSLTSPGKCKTTSRYKFVRANLPRTPLKRKSPRALKTRFKVIRGTGTEGSRCTSKYDGMSRLRYRSQTYEASSPFARRNTWFRQDLQTTKIVTSDRKLLRIGRRPENKGDKVRKAKLLKIGGVFYRSTRTTLTRSTGRATAATTGEKSPYPVKGQVLSIRGSKFVLDKTGKTLRRLTPNKIPISRIHIGGVTFVPSTENTLVRSRVHETRNLVSQAKQRSIAVLTSKLRKNNQPCLIYQRLGKCRLLERGRCQKVHDPKKRAICNDFVNGKCLKSAAECRLSHDVGPEKMPTCHFFLEGCCVRDPCPYSHVKLNEKAAVCRDFLSGYCSAGEKCKKRHVFLCPEYEETKRCSKGKYCSYRHAGEERAKTRAEVGSDRRAGASSATARSAPEVPTTSSKEPADPLTRYYLKNDGHAQTDEKDGGCDSGSDSQPVLLHPERSKLGHLPGFIPL